MPTPGFGGGVAAGTDEVTDGRAPVVAAPGDGEPGRVKVVDRDADDALARVDVRVSLGQ